MSTLSKLIGLRLPAGLSFKLSTVRGGGRLCCVNCCFRLIGLYKRKSGLTRAMYNKIIIMSSLPQPLFSFPVGAMRWSLSVGSMSSSYSDPVKAQQDDFHTSLHCISCGKTVFFKGKKTLRYSDTVPVTKFFRKLSAVHLGRIFPLLNINYEIQKTCWWDVATCMESDILFKLRLKILYTISKQQPLNKATAFSIQLNLNLCHWAVQFSLNSSGSRFKVHLIVI